jgi:hypothetical protein
MDNKDLCRAAQDIQKILAKGCHLAVWSNAYGQKSLYLVKDGSDPWNGAYVCKFEAH